MWVAGTWALMSSSSVYWPGPIAPIWCLHTGDVGCGPTQGVSAEVLAGPLAILVVLVGATWLGARFATGHPGPAEPASEPADPGGPIAASTPPRLLVGGATVIGLAGVAALTQLAWVGIIGSTAWTELSSAPFLPTVLAVLTAWAVSGSGRGTTRLALVAALLLIRPMDAPAIAPGPVAALVGIATVVIASAHRPLAERLRRAST